MSIKTFWFSYFLVIFLKAFYNNTAWFVVEDHAAAMAAACVPALKRYAMLFKAAHNASDILLPDADGQA